MTRTHTCTFTYHAEDGVQRITAFDLTDEEVADIRRAINDDPGATVSFLARPDGDRESSYYTFRAGRISDFQTV